MSTTTLSHPQPWAAPGPSVPEAGRSREKSQTPGSLRHSIILASEVFKEASCGAMWVVMVGEQVAGSPTFSLAPAWTGTLQSEAGEFKPCPQGLYSQPFHVPGAEAPRGPGTPLSQASPEIMGALSPGRMSWLLTLQAHPHLLLQLLQS